MKSDKDKLQEVEDALDGGITFYDPPSGWQHGFPKPYRPLPGETIIETLIRDGYPEGLARTIGYHCRFWTEKK